MVTINVSVIIKPLKKDEKILYKAIFNFMYILFDVYTLFYAGSVSGSGMYSGSHFGSGLNGKWPLYLMIKVYIISKFNCITFHTYKHTCMT